MKIKELKEYLNALPEELNNYDIVYCETHILNEEDKTWAREDMQIDSIVIDQDHDEMCMGKWETINNMLKLSESEKNNKDILPDGEYACLWSGYEIKVNFDGKVYNLNTHSINKGVKGINCPAIVIIKNGEIENARA